jgi:hypothetical protein
VEPTSSAMPSRQPFLPQHHGRQAPVQYEPAAEPGAQGVGRSVKQAERQPHQRAHRGLLIRKANYAIEAADSTFMPALRKLLKRA